MRKVKYRGIYMLYRVKQFLWGITAKLNDEDKEFINNYLNEYERKLFFSLPVYEQVHSLRVAKGVLKESKDKGLYDVLIVKAALLHDIGKINSGLNLITKSIIVILDKLTSGRLKKLTGITPINVYYNHPEIAMSYLEDEDKNIKYLIRNHHNYSLNSDKRLKILQEIDSKS
jgi:hypothetical protein